MSSASNSSSYTTDNVDHVFKKQTLRHGKLMLWAKLIENGRYNNQPQISLITGSSKSLSDFTYNYHWDNKCLTCKTLAGYRATRSPFKVQLCQIVQKLKISQGLVSRLLGDGGEKDYWCPSWYNKITCWSPMLPHYQYSLHQMAVSVVAMSVESWLFSVCMHNWS